MEKIKILPDKQKLIKQIPVFSRLNFSEQKIIAESAELFSYKKDEFIYKENDSPDALYCIISGRVKAFTKDASGKEIIIEHLYRGTYFGIISLLTGNNHSVTAQVINDSLILKIAKSDFDVILKKIPQLSIGLSQNLLRRVKRKDIHEKRIFESSIISVFSVKEESLDSQIYSINLATSLKNETKKNVILIDVFSHQSRIIQICKIQQDTAHFKIDEIVPKENKVKDHILGLKYGIDFMSVNISDSFDIKAMMALLGLLVNDYHYVIVNADFRSNHIYDFLSQMDTIQLMSGATVNELEKANLLMDKLLQKSSQIEDKVRIIILESSSVEEVPYRQRKKILPYNYFATLKISREAYFEEQPLVVHRKDIEYSKAIRRISRDMAGLRIGIVLGSGAALGLTQIGVIKVLEEEGIPIDVICGSSIGAFFGGLWAIGKSSNEIEKIALNYKKLESIFNMTDFVFPLRGLVKGRRLLRYLEHIFDNKTFFDVKKSFKVIACDVATMEEVVLEEGDVARAVMASISIPALFEPVQVGNRYFIDGGVLNPLPCDILLGMGIKKIIAVNVLPSSEDIARTYEEVRKQQADSRKAIKPNIFNIIVTTMQSMEYKIAQMSGETQADVVLHPDVSNIRWYEFYSAKDLIKRGEEEARRNINKIKELAKQ